MRLRPRRLACACVALAAGVAPVPGFAQNAAPPAAPAATAAPAPTPVVLEVELNGQNRGSLLLLVVGGRFHVADADLRAWGVRAPAGGGLRARGQQYWALDEAQLSVVAYDAAQARLQLSAPAAVFEPSALALPQTRVPVTPAGLGGFFNYDLLATAVGGQQTADGAFELGLFGSAGVFTHQFVERGLIEDSLVPRRYERIATTFRRDWPERMATLEAGDAVSRPGATGRALRYGGVGYHTNFTLRPGFIEQPLPSFTGEAQLPSTVQVFVQNQLRSTASVPPGPFTLSNVPVISGAGDVRLVVRDALGREQVITSSFYVTSGLLRAGLNDVAFAAGRLRSYGTLGDSEYGNGYASALWRHGLSAALTLEARAEAEEGRTRGLGAAANVALPLGELELAAAVSDVSADPAATGAGGTGALAAVGYRYLDRRRSLALRYERAANGYAAAGESPTEPTPARTITASGTHQLGRTWNAGFAFTQIEQVQGPTLRSVLVNASTQLGHAAYASLGVHWTRDSASILGTQRVVSLFLSVPLDPVTYATAAWDGGAQRQRTLALQRALPVGEGIGYRLAAVDRTETTRAEAAATWQRTHAAWTAEAEWDRQAGSAWRAGVAGSLAAVQGVAFAARALPDSFAVIEVPGTPGVNVFLNNQPAGRTDEHGVAVLPRLSAYAPSEVRVDVDELPADAQVTRDRTLVVPPYRSGVKVVLEVQRVASALVRVRRADGSPVPAGASVQVEPEGTVSSVSGRSEFFYSGTPGARRATLQWRDGRCIIEFDVAAPGPEAAGYRSLGPLTCR